MDIATLKKSIDTIFVVMLENRSFDHVLGHKFGVPALTNPSSRDANRRFEPVLHRDHWIDTDLPHGRDQIEKSLEGAMRGFVRAYEDQIGAPAPRDCPAMWYLDRQDLPVTNFLADNFRVCQRWHASLPCDTMPNRLMAMSGGTLIDDTSAIDPVAGRWLPDQYTIFEWAAEHITERPPFGIYVDADSIPRIGFPSTFFLMKRLHPFLEGRQFGLDSLEAHIAAWDPQSADPRERPPALVFCEPFFNDLAIKVPLVNLHGNCNHAPLPMAFGEAFLKKVYDAVSGRPEIWSRSLLIVTYDEHGGFFDHVSPPPMRYPPPAGASWSSSSPIETLGVRVPATLISPWVRKTDAGDRAADDLLFDHTSIIQLAVDRFGVPGDLARFGHAQARSATVRSLREALADTPDLAPPAIAPDPPTPPDPPRALAPMASSSSVAMMWASHLDA